jgi:hypothetical protein
MSNGVVNIKEVEMAAETEKLARDLIAAINSQDVDRALSFFADDCVYEDVAVGSH